MIHIYVPRSSLDIKAYITNVTSCRHHYTLLQTRRNHAYVVIYNTQQGLFCPWNNDADDSNHSVFLEEPV